jgi:hypothetical protein
VPKTEHNRLGRIVFVIAAVVFGALLGGCTSTASQPASVATVTRTAAGATSPAAPASSATPITSATSVAPATSATAALRVSADIDLGISSTLGQAVAAEAPDGTVFYADGQVVMVVSGNSPPAVAEHPGAKVLGLGASSSTLYVVTPADLLAYSRSSGDQTGRWLLTGSPATPTTAGVVVDGAGDAWVWTDWATDFSGYENAMLYALLPGVAKPVVLSHVAEPGSVTTDGTHAFFLADNNNVGASLTQATRIARLPAVRLLTVGTVPGESLIGFSRSQVVAYSQPHSLYTFSPGGTGTVLVKTRTEEPVGLAGTNSGLLFLTCAGKACSTITPVDQSTGVPGVPASVPTSGDIVLGPDPVVVGVESGHLHLVRLS